MNKKIYFAGSIRGGRVDASLYNRMISFMKKDNIVLTEHIGNMDISIQESNYDQDIYQQDTNWIQECDVLIAECTCPSLGVGYELAYAEKLNKEVHIFYHSNNCQLSAMLKGNSYFNIHPYTEENEIYATLERILS